MVKITLDIEGMACGMCEAHVNDAVRRVFPVKKVIIFTQQGKDGNHCGNADRRKQPEECNRGNRIQGACRTY